MTCLAQMSFERLIRRSGIRSCPRFFAAVAIVTVIATAGCGPHDPRVTIRGKVMLDGQPLSGGQVVFIPENKSLRAEGAAVKDGGFIIRVHRGPHRVEINAEVEEKQTTGPNAPPEAGIVFRSLIPPRYNAQSMLSFDVKSAQDKPVFDLTSDK